MALAALESAGRHADAIVVATNHHLRPELFELLDRYGLSEVEAHRDVVAEALDEVGPPSPGEPAVVTALRGYLDGRLGRLDTAEAWFSLALNAVEDQTCRVQIALSYARDLMQRRRTDVAPLLEPYADLTSLSPEQLADVRSSLAQAHAIEGRHAEASRRSSQAQRLLDTSAPGALRARVLARGAYVALEGGDFRRAEALARRAARVAERSDCFDVAVSAYSVCYQIAADVHDDAPASLTALERLSDCAVKSGSFAADLYALLGIYELRADAGDEPELQRLDRALQAFDVQYTADGALEALLPAQALRASWRGNFKHAYRMLAPTAERQATASRRALRWAEVAVYAAAAGDDAVREAAAASQREIAEADASEAQTKRAWLFLALAAWLRAEPELARARLANLDAGALARTTRLCAMHAAFTALLAPDAHFECGRRRMRTALSRLRAAHVGGIALLLEALPQPALPAASGSPITVGADLALDVVLERFIAVVRGDLEPEAFERWLEDARGADIARRAMPPPAEGAAALLALRAAELEPDANLRGLAAVESLRRTNAPANVPQTEAALNEIDAALNGLLLKLDVTSPLMAEHSRAVAGWCTRLGRWLGLEYSEVLFVSRCGLIHDIGKSLTPLEILDAPRKLTTEEWEIMRRHSADGAAMVAQIETLAPFVPIVRWHHERLDGRGYPDGLKGAQIPMAARIVSVADCFNAMIGRRTYRPPMPPSFALAELERCRGTQFDPDVVDAMHAVVMRLRALET